MTAWLGILLMMDPHAARKRPVGADIRLEGFVTVPSGALESVMGDNGFVLGDALTGIYVATEKKGYYSVGREMEVTGTLIDNGRGMLMLRARSINTGKGRRIFKPWRAESALDEFYEGRIVRIEGEVARVGRGGLVVRDAKGASFEVRLLPGVQAGAGWIAVGTKVRATGLCIQDGPSYAMVVRTAKDLAAAEPAGRR